MYKAKYKITQQDIEPVYNHVHHAHTLKFLERARLDFLIYQGVPNDSLIEQNLFLVITDISVKYLRELFEGDIEVTCKGVEIMGKQILMEQEIFNEKGKVCVKAVVTSMFMDGNTKRATIPSDSFTQKFLA